MFPRTPWQRLGQMPEETKERLCAAILLIVAALVYSNTFRNAFTWDDLQLYVVKNPQVTDPSLRAIFSAHKATNVFRPLTFASFALDWKAGGGQPLVFHVVNLALHAGVSWLLYLLLQAALAVSPRAKTAAFAAALLFAVHPIHVEAVASIAGRAELFAAGFLLAAWLLHLKDRFVPSLICFALALMSKESAVVFLPLAMLGDYARGHWKRSARYLAIGGVTLLYLGVLWRVQGGRFGEAHIPLINNPLAALPVGWRVLNAIRIAWKYVGLQLFPATLSCDYSFDAIPVYLDWRHTVPAAAAAVAAVGAWLWAGAKRQFGIALAGGIYLAGFAVTANVLMPIGTVMGERLAYFPSAGLCLLAALAWLRLERANRKIAAGVLAALVVTLGARSLVRNGDWKDNLTLDSAAVRAVPRSAKAHAALAEAHAASGRLEEAQREIEAALSIYPDYLEAMAAGGLLESWRGNYQAAGAMMERAFSMVRRDDPHYDEILVNLAGIYMQANRMDEALALLDREVAEAPQYGRAWANRAVVHYRRGETAAARADAETALRLDPGNQQARNLQRLLGSPAPAVDAR